ncbi:nitroreductase family protein [Nonomuraea fuscirosea]|uniref:nitroreductase family protein n=1 Tax=Nonomuraea fuscirosea TaxID=1291556 RepID=UPI003412A8A0
MEAAVEAARWAPSVHNTQPWTFSVSGEEISLKADTDRRRPRPARPGPPVAARDAQAGRGDEPRRDGTAARSADRAAAFLLGPVLGEREDLERWRAQRVTRALYWKLTILRSVVGIIISQAALTAISAILPL